MPPKLFLLACEPSGDTHGAALVEELKKLDPSVDCRGLGGPKMAAAGVRILHDMTRISVLGLGDVLAKYFTYRKIFYEALREVNRSKPDAIILIDSPAFNLRFAKKIAKKFPVIYYISPQIWAWGSRRIHTIKRTVSKMIVILPFEVKIYEEAGVPCEFVGHPLLDVAAPSARRETLRREFGIGENEKAIGLLPGSRVLEVERILPLMLETAVHLKKMVPETTFFLTESPNVPSKVYDKILSRFTPFTLSLSPTGGEGGVRGKNSLNIHRFKTRNYDVLSALDFALIASGTATLEAALLGTPFFLLYKASWTTYWLARLLIGVPFLGMVNLLEGRRAVPEFYQNDIHPRTIAHDVKVVLENRELYERMKEDFLSARRKLGEKGASRRAAEAILSSIPSPATRLQ